MEKEENIVENEKMLQDLKEIIFNNKKLTELAVIHSMNLINALTNVDIKTHTKSIELLLKDENMLNEIAEKVKKTFSFNIFADMVRETEEGLKFSQIGYIITFISRNRRNKKNNQQYRKRRSI